MKVGLLPLYVKMYDDFIGHLRPRLEAFYETIASEIEARGVEVVRSPFCRLDAEFKETVANFEAADVDALITLHMAYSPSLESIEALKATKLPIIVLDTTETLEFGNMQSGGEINYNHGIHGVMDMCSMLKRNGVPYGIVAGHYKESNVIDRMCGMVKAAISAKALKNAHVALLGQHFAGMGDFLLPDEMLKDELGIQVTNLDPKEMNGFYDSVTDAEIDAEIADNAAIFDFDNNIDADEYRITVKSCLAMRKCIEKKGLTAFTATFSTHGLNVSGLATIPFIEACKGMQRGIGYAGEGDTLTAAFVGAFLQGFKDTNFVEIFCPDWKNNLLFMSHMAEVNLGIINSKPFVSRCGRNYSEGTMPYAPSARMKGGKGVFLNVCRGKDDFKLVISDCEMMEYAEDNFEGSVRGWMKTQKDMGLFLADYSKYGATHHSVFVYDATIADIQFFGELIGVETVVI